MRFLRDSEKFATVVFAEFNVEVLTLDLQFPSLYEVIHFWQKRRSLGHSAAKRKGDFLPKRAIQSFVVNNFSPGNLTAARPFFCALVRDRKIDLLFERIHACNKDADIVADLVSAI